MKYTVVRERLLSALQKASLFVSTHLSDGNALKGVLISASLKDITLSTTNINEFFSTELGGKVEREGNVLVDFKMFFEIVRTLSDVKITVEKVGNMLEIGGGSGVVKLVTSESSSFPKPVEVLDGQELNDLLFDKTLFEKILFAASTDETRPSLTGVCLDFQEKGVNMVATDGFRLSLIHIPMGEKILVEGLEGEKILIPARALSGVQKVFSTIHKILFSPSERVIIFDGEGMKVSVRLLDGEYPPYNKVIPSAHETRVVVKHLDFLNALKAVSLFARDASNMILLEIKNKNMIVSAANSGVGEAHFTTQISSLEGKDNSATFNHRFLLDFVHNISDDEVVVEIGGAFSPGVFKVLTNPNFIHIIMPIRT